MADIEWILQPEYLFIGSSLGKNENFLCNKLAGTAFSPFTDFIVVNVFYTMNISSGTAKRFFSLFFG